MTADIDFTGNMGGNATSLIFTMTGNGTIDATEGPISYNLTFTNYSISDTYTPGTSFDTDNIATNGKVSESWTIGPGYIRRQHFLRELCRGHQDVYGCHGK